MGKVSRVLEVLSKENMFSKYAAIFRVFISFHIIKKVYLGWGSLSLVYGTIVETKSTITSWIPFVNLFGQEIPLLSIFLVLLSFLFAFGVGKSLTALLLFICVYFNGEIIYLHSNGGDNLLTYVCLYLIFVNSYDYLSFKKIEYKNSKIKNLSVMVSNLAVYSIMIHLCLVYFVSFIHKIHADEWYNGVATYYILNLERYNSPLNHLFSKNAFVVGFSTYFTLAFELFFPILIWNKNFRNILLLSGIGLHLGIYFFMMIYDFEILFIMIYGFFLTNQEWTHIINFIKHKLKWKERRVQPIS